MNFSMKKDVNVLDYTDGKVLFKLMKRIKELNILYYINASGEILTYWQGGWSYYHDVMKTYPAMNININK